jgi:hypothetical protein
MVAKEGGEMLTCELRVNDRLVGVLTAHQVRQKRRKGCFAYGCVIRTPEGIARNVILWHRPSDGIWALVQRVIEELHPEKWFPGPDRKES